jgi:hypothetical protein
MHRPGPGQRAEGRAPPPRRAALTAGRLIRLIRITTALAVVAVAAVAAVISYQHSRPARPKPSRRGLQHSPGRGSALPRAGPFGIPTTERLRHSRDRTLSIQRGKAGGRWDNITRSAYTARAAQVCGTTVTWQPFRTWREIPWPAARDPWVGRTADGRLRTGTSLALVRRPPGSRQETG